MKINKVLVCAVALVGFAASGCGSVEGTYKLDKAATKKAMEASAAKLPADQQAGAKLGEAMLDAMDLSLELKAGGKASMKSTMPNLFDDKKPPKTDEDTGTWKKDGDTITITGAKAKDSFTCTKKGSKLECKEPNSKEDFEMIFSKA